MNSESPLIELQEVTRRFGTVTALDRVSLTIPRGRVVGLIGRNGSGKSTLLRNICGLQLPTEGTCRTLGVDSRELDARQLGRIGLVQQEERFLHWMTVREHLDHVGSFYPAWDRDLEARLIDELEVDVASQVGVLSPGNRQKLAILLAVCHRPDLLLLDEPVSDLDPIARERLLSFLLELLQSRETTIIISSHVLRDIERAVDWIVCLEGGRVVCDCALDELQERFEHWRVTRSGGAGALPTSFDEPFVKHQLVNGIGALLTVRRDGVDDARLNQFCNRHGVEVVRRPLSLDAIFPLLIAEGER